MSAITKLYKKKKNSEDIQELQDLFAAQPVQIQQIKKQVQEQKQKIVDEADEMELEDIDNQIEEEEAQEDQINNPFVSDEQSILQKKDRDERTIFIGNVPFECSKKDVIKIFKKYGKIENIRERSVPIRSSKDLPVKARVIMKMTNEGNKDDMVKNCYILFEKKEDAEKSLEKNGFEYKGNFLRVDTANQSELDYTKTIFVGNLSYTCNENALRKHFTPCGTIVMVRMIRDKETHQGKGFGYVQFENDEGYQNALSLKNSKLEKRELRIKKAVPKAKLDKKRAKKEDQRKQNQDFALKRIKDKMKGQLSETKSVDSAKKIVKKGKSAAQDFVKNQMENIDDFDMKNEIVIPPRMVRKAIKKGKQRGDDASEQFKKVQKMTKKFHQANDRNIFNNTKALQQRKDNRKKKMEFNRKKVKRQVINE